MLEEYKVDNKQNNADIEEHIYRLVTLTIESGFYYNSKNELVITKSQNQIAKEINENLDEYCKSKGIDKEYAMKIAKETIRSNNELRFNPTERKMAMDLLGIEDDEEER